MFILVSLLIKRRRRIFSPLIVFHFYALACLLPCLLDGIQWHCRSVPNSIAFIFSTESFFQINTEPLLLIFENICVPLFILGALYIIAPVYFSRLRWRSHHALHEFRQWKVFTPYASSQFSELLCTPLNMEMSALLWLNPLSPITFLPIDHYCILVHL